uniref:Uncharacterized protein n=1 Tax=Ditylenchus dipsaci TaxID=166011 RepID=A0A915DED0_9BILA
MIIRNFSVASVLFSLVVVTIGAQLVIQQPISDGTNRKPDLSVKKDKASKETGIQCPKETFKCEGSGRCIPMSWRCDSESDCEKGDDELNCSSETQQCNPDKEYQCSASKDGTLSLPLTSSTHLMNLYGSGSLFAHHCIPKAWQCDGEGDCINKDDEDHCEKVTCDNQTHFECRSFDTNSPSCIPKEWVCDGQTDCLNGLDEQNCKNHSRSACDADTEFQCNDGLCIYKNWHCDGDSDCVDGSDETGCHTDKACEKSGKFKSFSLHSWTTGCHRSYSYELKGLRLILVSSSASLIFAKP